MGRTRMQDERASNAGADFLGISFASSVGRSSSLLSSVRLFCLFPTSSHAWKTYNERYAPGKYCSGSRSLRECTFLQILLSLLEPAGSLNRPSKDWSGGDCGVCFLAGMCPSSALLASEPPIFCWWLLAVSFGKTRDKVERFVDPAMSRSQ
jgi:hypothetical protein